MPKLDKDQYTKAEVEELIRKGTEESLEKAEVAELVAEMTDIEKNFYKTLDGDEKQEFLFMDTAERANKVKKSQDDDPVVYTATDGTEYRKSDGERLVKLAKKSDADSKNVADLQKTANESRITKMAEEELKFIPGELSTRVALIKAVELIPDATEREASMTALKAQNAQMAKAFNENGTREGLELLKGGAHGELEALAKKYQGDHPDVNSIDAYNKVAEANPDLYAKAVNGE